MASIVFTCAFSSGSNSMWIFNVDQLDPDCFMDELNRCGLPWQVVDFTGALPD